MKQNIHGVDKSVSLISLKLIPADSMAEWSNACD